MPGLPRRVGQTQDLAALYGARLTGNTSRNDDNVNTSQSSFLCFLSLRLLSSEVTLGSNMTRDPLCSC